MTEPELNNDVLGETIKHILDSPKISKDDNKYEIFHISSKEKSSLISKYESLNKIFKEIKCNETIVFTKLKVDKEFYKSIVFASSEDVLNIYTDCEYRK